jgi:plastocyanin
MKGAGLSGAALVGAGLAGGAMLRGQAQEADASSDHAAQGGRDIPTGGTMSANQYGGLFDPPAYLDAAALDALTFPPPRDDLPPGATRSYTLDIVERHVDVSSDVAVHAWTYRLADPSAPSGGDLSQPVTPHGWTSGGFAPGPTLRAKEGDLLRVTVRNRTEHPHNLHFHGRHSPQMDGWEPIPPGEETTYEMTAAPFGVHPYHCHVMPIAEHIARGMHGVLIVDPPGPRPPALEVLLVLCGWDPDGVQRSSVVTWNGVAGYYAKFPIKAPVGERVRLYLVNMLEYEPVGSFHLHAQTFDLFPSGTSLTPLVHTDVVTLGMAERAILEFVLPERGRYMFHPHQHHLADRGAMGWFSAI